ncbi:MAG: hypothetical protein AB1330_01705 [Bacillota bacterium]
MAAVDRYGSFFFRESVKKRHRLAARLFCPADVTVRMPPIKKYDVELEIKGVKKTEPKVIEPEEFK